MLTTLILETTYMKNSFFKNADQADIHDNVKNNSVTKYANYASFQNQIRNNFIIDYVDFRDNIKHNFTTDYSDFRDYINIISPVTMLTTLTFKNT